MSRSAKTKAKLYSVLVSLPRAAGGRSLIGLAFRAQAGQVSKLSPINPIVMFRHTATYLRERGGAAPGLAKKHILIMGCGSVGSEIADALASSGLGKLTLVDPDIFSEENIFRHVLGRRWIGKLKVAGLKHELMEKYPGLQIVAEPRDATNWLTQRSLSGFDGVVLALGLPTLEKTLCRSLRASEATIPFVHTWLEPLDLGGHSVLLSTKGKGCFGCLFLDDEGSESLVPQTAFLAPGQKVSKNITGCASVFIPYGAIQARRTALMAADQILRAVNQFEAASYNFWVGSGEIAAQNSIRSTSWWKRAKTCSSEEATRILFARPCRYCRGLPCV